MSKTILNIKRIKHIENVSLTSKEESIPQVQPKIKIKQIDWMENILEGQSPTHNYQSFVRNNYGTRVWLPMTISRDNKGVYVLYIAGLAKEKSDELITLKMLAVNLFHEWLLSILEIEGVSIEK